MSTSTVDDEYSRLYNPRLGLTGIDAQLAALTELSAATRKRLPFRETVPYGPTSAEYLDICTAEGVGRPVHIFIHGGFWRSFSAKDYSFVAAGLHDRGVHTVVVNYGLYPDVDVGEIVRQGRAAVAWVHRNADSFGGDASRISVSGHSAGAHIAAMILATDWQGRYGLPGDIVRGACLVSGLFDLAPLRRTWLQPFLEFSDRDVRSNSPIHALPAPGPRLLVAVGGDEPAGFQSQAEAYVRALRDHGHILHHRTVPGCNHIDILHDLRAGAALFEELVGLILET